MSFILMIPDATGQIGCDTNIKYIVIWVCQNIKRIRLAEIPCGKILKKYFCSITCVMPFLRAMTGYLLFVRPLPCNYAERTRPFSPRVIARNEANSELCKSAKMNLLMNAQFKDHAPLNVLCRDCFVPRNDGLFVVLISSPICISNVLSGLMVSLLRFGYRICPGPCRRTAGYRFLKKQGQRE